MSEEVIDEVIPLSELARIYRKMRARMDELTKAYDTEVETIKEKLDLILQMNSTCEGAIAVKTQYDQLVKARMLEIEKNIIPLLLNLKKNKERDYIYWPGMQRLAQCDLQLQKIVTITRASL